MQSSCHIPLSLDTHTFSPKITKTLTIREGQNRGLASIKNICYSVRPGSPGAGRLSLRLTEGLLSLRSYERRDVNDYICGVDPILYLHCWTCQSVLPDFQGQKVNGRHYRN